MKKCSTYTTSLRNYLEVIYPGYEFIFDKTYSSDSFKKRNTKDLKYRRFRPDAICEELNLVVEFDGLQHYTNVGPIYGDPVRDKWFNDLGYSVIRIPYWIQLSNENIKYLFGVEVSEEMCKLEYSFYDAPLEPNKSIPGLMAGPGAMCELGRFRFINEFNGLPEYLRNIVYRDLLFCMEKESLDYSLVLPPSVERKLNIPESFDNFLKTSAHLSVEMLLRW